MSAHRCHLSSWQPRIHNRPFSQRRRCGRAKHRYLTLVAYFLGIQPSALENALSYKTKMVKKELCTVFLDPDGGSNNCSDLAKTVYSPVHMACPAPTADGGAGVDTGKVEVS